MSKKLINKVSNGLSNRIISIISSQRIAKISERKLSIVWEKNATCPCEFEEIFYKPKDFFVQDPSVLIDSEPTYMMIDQLKGIDLINNKDDIISIKSPILNIDKSQTDEIKKTIPLIKDIYNIDGSHKFHLGENQGWRNQNFAEEANLHRNALIKIQRYCYEYIEKYLLDYLISLPIKKDILDEVEKFEKQYFNDKTIGLHIRLTDNTFPYSTIETFENKAQERIDAGFNIFLSSDNENSNDILKEKFKDKIIIYKKIYNNKNFVTEAWPPRAERTTSVRDSFIDLLLLSKTKFIYKPVFSTYSMLAANIGGLDYECIYD